MRGFWSWALALLWTAVLAAGNARAAGAPEQVAVAVFPISVEGELDAHEIEELHDRLLQTLSKARVVVVSPSDVLATAPGAAECGDALCVSRAAQAAGTTHVIRTTIVRRSRDYEITMTIVNGSDGAVVTSTEGTCEICGFTELSDELVARASQLAARLRSLEVPPGKITIEGTPAGARVRLNGRRVGTVPLEVPIGPGEHLVRVEHSGHAAVERRVSASPGTSEHLKIDLQPLDSETRKSLAPPGWASVGLGVASLGTGVALLAIDHRPIQRKCNGDDVDADGDCRVLYDTLGGGIAFAAVGVALVGTGIGLLVAQRKRSGKGKSARARVRPSPSGVAIAF